MRDLQQVLLTFVDCRDPFSRAPIGEEDAPGPILSLLSDRPFDRAYLFHTPHALGNARETQSEIRKRFPEMDARLIPLEIADPWDLAGIMRALAPHFREVVAHPAEREYFACASSGTPAMLAAWFLLAASGRLHARLLRVEPARPGSGERPRITETPPADGWEDMQRTLGSVAAAPAASEAPMETEPPHAELEEALQELEIFIASSKLHAVAEQIALLAAQNVPVLLLGETGTGKELFARLLHRLSGRRRRPFVTVDCASVPPALAESALFGHVRGSFPGATRDHRGRLEEAHGGTVLLDEPGALPAEAQVKLMRVLEQGIVEPAGASKGRKVDVRIVAAARRGLHQDAAAGRFRQDLCSRLEAAQVRLPPLRERRDEIPPLAGELLSRVNRTLGRTPRRLAKSALVRLRAHSWPGNVRELASVIQRSVLLSPKEVLEDADLLLTEPEPDSST